MYPAVCQVSVAVGGFECYIFLSITALFAVTIFNEYVSLRSAIFSLDVILCLESGTRS